MKKQEKEYFENLQKLEKSELENASKKQAEILAKRKMEAYEKYRIAKAKKEKQKYLKSLSKSTIIIKTPLYKRYEEKYKKEVVLPMIKKSSEILENKRKIFLQKINHEEIDKHAKSFENIIENRKFLKNKEIIENRKNEKIFMKLKKSLVTPVSERVQKIDISYKEEKEKIQKRKKEFHTICSNYSKFVKESIKIKPNISKTIELKERISELKKSVRIPKNTKKDYIISNIFKQNKSANISQNSSFKIIKKAKTPQIKEEKPKKSINYLDIIRNQRMKKEENLLRSVTPSLPKLPQICDGWKQDLKNEKLNKNQKVNKILGKVEYLDDVVNRNEKLLKFTGNKDLETKVNFMLVDSIKAKLAILNELN